MRKENAEQYTSLTRITYSFLHTQKGYQNVGLLSCKTVNAIYGSNFVIIRNVFGTR
jgi:hypothetical protein